MVGIQRAEQSPEERRKKALADLQGQHNAGLLSEAGLRRGVQDAQSAYGSATRVMSNPALIDYNSASFQRQALSLTGAAFDACDQQLEELRTIGGILKDIKNGQRIAIGRF